MTNLTFEWQIDEFMVYCQSKQLRPKTMQSYEQALRLFARWCEEERHIEAVDKVKEADIRHYLKDVQQRGKYTVYVSDKKKQTNCPERRRDYRQAVTLSLFTRFIAMCASLEPIATSYQWSVDAFRKLKGFPRRMTVLLNSSQKASLAAWLLFNSPSSLSFVLLRFTKSLRVRVALSPTFYAWVASLGKRAKIMEPPTAIEGMKKFLQDASCMYEDDGKM